MDRWPSKDRDQDFLASCSTQCTHDFTAEQGALFAEHILPWYSGGLAPAPGITQSHLLHLMRLVHLQHFQQNAL